MSVRTSAGVYTTVGAAKELHDLLESRGVSVWFSEKDVALGTPLLREIDKGFCTHRDVERASHVF